MSNVIERKSESESGSGGKGALGQIKTVGKGRMVEAVRNGGRDGFIGGSEKGLVDIDGHEHGHDQKHELAHSCLSSVAAPRGSPPVAHSHENVVLTTTPAMTTTKDYPGYNGRQHWIDEAEKLLQAHKWARLGELFLGSNRLAQQ